MMIKGRTYCLVLSIISFVYFWLKATYHLQSNSPEYFPRTFVTNDYIIHALITQIYCVFMCYCVIVYFVYLFTQIHAFKKVLWVSSLEILSNPIIMLLNIIWYIQKHIHRLFSLKLSGIMAKSCTALIIRQQWHKLVN